MSLSTTIKCGIKVLDSLEILHDMGYVHADIKPNNMMVRDRNFNEDS